MPKPNPRAKFTPDNLSSHLKKYEKELPMNVDVFEELTNPETLIYTSPADLPLTASVPFYPLRGGLITAVRANVKTAPSGDDAEVDILIDGISVFDGAYVTIPDGSRFGKSKYPKDAVDFQADSKLQVQIIEDGGAEGPMVVAIEYEATSSGAGEGGQ